MNWFLASLLAGFFFAASRLVASSLLRGRQNVLLFTAIHDFFAGLIMLPLLLFGFQFDFSGTNILVIIGIIIFAFFTDFFSLSALKHIEASEAQVIGQIRHPLLLVIGLGVYNEPITALKVIAIGLLIVGVVIALYRKQKFVWNIGVLYAVLSMLAFVVAFSLEKTAVTSFSPTLLTLMSLWGISLLAFGLSGFKFKLIKDELVYYGLPLVIAGLIFGVFLLFNFLALETGEISRVAPVTQSSLLFLIIGGFAFLGERGNLVYKLTGTILIIIAIMLLN